MARLTTGKSLGIAGAIAAAITGTALFLSSSNVSRVPPGESVQAAINAAECGAVIELDAGTAYPVNLTLPNKPCDATTYITVQSSRANELPEGVRVTPNSPLFAKLQSVVDAEPVVRTLTSAHHYKFIGIQFETRDAGVFVYDLVRFGEGRGEQKTLDSVPHHLVIDRSYIHGWPTQDVQRGVTLNSASTDITNSYISDIHGVGNDTQAVCGWNGTNTVRLINNHLEGAGENIMFGGADSATAELMPANIEIRRNHVFKPRSWKVGDPTYAGKHWTIKNLLELKAARNVVIDGNYFENNWTDGQAGVAILFTVRNQDCAAPWSTVQNVTFSNNTVRGSDGGAFNFLGKDNEAEAAYGKCTNPATMGSIRGDGFTGVNNLVYDIGGSFLTLNGFDNVSFNRTTHTQRGNFTTIYGQPSRNWHYTNNLMVDHEYGMYIEAGSGIKGLDILTPGWMVQDNVIYAVTDKANWPLGNQFVDLPALPADFRSPYPNAGADIDALLAAQSSAGTSQPSPTATATVTPSPSPTPQPTASTSPSPAVTSPNNTRVPPDTQLVDAAGGVWTLNGQIMLRNGQNSGGQGPLLLFCNQQVYAIGVDANWWHWLSGVNWERAASDPCAAPSPNPIPTAVPTATPTPSPVPTVQPSPSPKPSPTATVLPICKPNQTVGNPPVCRCLTGMKGSSGKCR